MRITNNLIVRRQLQGLQANARALDEAQQRVTSGKKVERMSDDPTSGGAIMATASGLRAIEQYRRNVDLAQSRVDTEDQVLQQVGVLLTRAKEIAISQAGDSANASTRLAAGAEVDQIFRQVVNLAATRHGDDHLFGGESGGTAPFTVTGAAGSLGWAQAGGVGARQVEVGAGQAFAATHDGKTVFVDTGVLASLRDLANTLTGAPGSVAGVQGALGGLDAAFDQVQALVGDTGARANSLQMAASNLDAFEASLTTFRSDLEDEDVEKAVTSLVSRQTAYQAAMLASSKVLSLNLTDYLR